MSHPLAFTDQTIPSSWAASDVGKGNTVVKKKGEQASAPSQVTEICKCLSPCPARICYYTLPVNGSHKQSHLAAAAKGNVTSTAVYKPNSMCTARRGHSVSTFTRLWHCWRTMPRQHAAAMLSPAFRDGWSRLHTEGEGPLIHLFIS